MSFRLNQAPRMVINAITKEKIARGCGIFWSVICCLPSLGLSLGCLDDQTKATRGCCYPNPVSTKTNGSLISLVDTLNNDVIKKSFTPEELKNPQQTYNIIDWQVRETLELVKKAITGNLVEGTYKIALQAVYDEIYAIANAEAQFKGVLEKDPLLGHEIGTHSYGLVGSK